jgi:hypothetical protein
MSRTVAPWSTSLFPADFFTITIHLLAFSRVVRHAVPAAKPYCALEVDAGVIMVGQEAPPSYLRVAIHLGERSRGSPPCPMWDPTAGMVAG